MTAGILSLVTLTAIGVVFNVLQIGDPVILKLIDQLGAPVVLMGLYIAYDRLIVRRRGGVSSKDTTKEALTDVLHRLDLAMTEHFDQLRRDLETKIEKTMENRLTAYLFESELRRSRRKEDR